MTITSDYVKSITDVDRLAIIRGYEQLERDGSIGEDPLREHTRLLLAQHNISDHVNVVWMTLMSRIMG